VWDPVFGPASSAAVLDSQFSRSLPVPDALLGATAYGVEAGLGLALAALRRGRRTYLKLSLAAVALITAFTGLLLVSIQAFWVGRFCSLCLLSASLSWLDLWLARPQLATGLDWLLGFE
jgi:uncharacterized membrane protein